MEKCDDNKTEAAAPTRMDWRDLGVEGVPDALVKFALPPRPACVPCGSRPHAEQELLPEGIALKSKFLFTKGEDLVVLGAAGEDSQNSDSDSEMEPEETTRAEAVAMATNNAGDESVGDREIVNNNNNTTTTTTAGEEPKTAAGKSGKKKKKKSAKKAASPAEDEDAASAKSQDAAKELPATPAEKWAMVWKLLESCRDMVNDKTNHGFFKAMLSRAMAMTSPDGATGPICSNPSCGSFGHTLAFCPVPTCPKHGDISGCFFCNVIDHDADDCSMMEWVSPAQLVTYLITNRAGMPPWNTRIDWVALALSEWDLVCFTMLPLTRAYVKKVYTPGQRWKEVNGVSPITDPIFKNASRKLLKDLARKASPDDPRPRRPLMEASQDMCYCRNSACHDGVEHTVFKNETLQRFIPDMRVDKETYRRLVAERRADVAATQALMEKKVPKKATKERKGRRAMKKEAMAAAAAAAAAEEQSAAGPSVLKNIPTDNNNNQVLQDESSDDDIPVSERLLELSDAVGELVENIQKIIRS